MRTPARPKAERSSKRFAANEVAVGGWAVDAEPRTGDSIGCPAKFEPFVAIGKAIVVRKRVRRIVVDGQTYGWRVRIADEDFVSLRLWRDGDRVPIADVRLPFDDPWLLLPEMAHVYSKMPDRFPDLFALDPVRPYQVAELIRACVGHAGPGRDFELVNGELRPVG